MMPLGETHALIAAPVIGFVFGWFLERGGLGSARKLAGQFHLTDFSLFRTLFTAIVTAMLGAFWLERVGVLDIDRIFIPETFLLPQAIGGAIFGAGFLFAGLCPGTSCVAGASGRIDGLAVMAGLLLGIAGFNAAFGLLAPLYESTSRGVLTLPQALDVPAGVVVFGVTVIALCSFAIAARIERRVRA